MPWLEKATKRHECRKPVMWPWLRSGSVWQCDSCGKIWELWVHPISRNRVYRELSRYDREVQ